MNAEKLAIKARESLGEFCYSECMAYCCRKGTLKVSKKEAELIISKDPDTDKITKINTNKFVLSLNSGCPALKDFKCLVHKNPKRPKMCREFPVFVEKNNIAIAERCYGKDKLYPFISQFRSQGFNVKFV